MPRFPSRVSSRRGSFQRAGSPGARDALRRGGAATLVWVDWFNNRRLLEPMGYVPPAELEATYYRRQASQAMVA